MQTQYKWISLVSMVLMALFLIWGCADLSVENENDPDTEKALGNSDDVEALLGGTYLSLFQGNQLHTTALPFSTLSDELTSIWGNWGMGTYAREPRDEFDNSTSNSELPMIERPWFNFYEVLSTCKDVWEVIEAGRDLGENGEHNMRAKAFIRFMQGSALGGTALLFDKGFIVDENTDLTETPQFSTYQEMMEQAILYFEECVTICEANQFTLPMTWINGVDVDNAYLARLAHSYAARFLAGVARTPQERTAVDWTRVAAHADAGITDEFIVVMDGNFWFDGYKYFGSREDWARADYFVIGYADTSGAFEDWAAADPADRTPFIIKTADLRIAGPDSTTAPGTDFSYNPNYPFETYRASWYRSRRYIDHFFSGATSPVSIFNPAELRLLKAEALYHQNSPGAAADIVNETRVARGGLAPVDGNDSDLYAKIKYEKRIEIFLSAGFLMYVEKRGWGELGKGAPLQMPIPASELEVLLEDNYTFGGEGGEWAAKPVGRHWIRFPLTATKQ